MSRTIGLFLSVTLALGATAAETAVKADKVLVLKKDRELRLLRGDKVLKKYKVALGGSPEGAKERQGDRKTPEGRYILDSRNRNSQFYRSIHINYPSKADRERARRMGVSPGGDLFIHGLPNGQGWIGSAHRLHDWTDGCIAVTNEEMDEIWAMVDDGTPIEIRP